MNFPHARRASPGRLSRRDQLACRDAVRLLADYLDGALPARDTDRLAAHLAGCPDCTRYLRQLQTTAELAGATEPRLDEATAQSLAAFYRGWRAEQS